MTRTWCLRHLGMEWSLCWTVSWTLATKPFIFRSVSTETASRKEMKVAELLCLQPSTRWVLEKPRMS